MMMIMHWGTQIPQTFKKKICIVVLIPKAFIHRLQTSLTVVKAVEFPRQLIFLLTLPTYIQCYTKSLFIQRVIKGLVFEGLPWFPVFKTLISQCREHSFNPWSGNEDPTCHMIQPKNKIK